MPDSRVKEFDKDLSFPILDLSTASARSPEDSLFTYCFDDINHLSKILGIPWELAKDIFLQHILSLSQRRRRKNTWPPFEIGKLSPCTPFKQYKNYMENFCMHPWFYLLGEPISSPSSPCYLFFTTICTCHVPLPSTQEKTSAGGKPVFSSPSSLVPFQGLSKSLTPRLTQMLAQVLALQFGSTVDGEYGSSSQDGKMRIETSVGQRQSGWSSSLSHSLVKAQKAAALKFSVTTGESSKAGGKAGVKTKPLTPSSNVSMSSLHLHSVLSSLALYPVPTIQRTAYPEEYTPPQAYCPPQYAFPKLSNPSSWTLTIPQSLLDAIHPVRTSKRNHSAVFTPAPKSPAII
ncbi:hypothetical protein BDR06DRAFT_1007433 [Suillus hirtellus]|nr:hypothetical protein BDR06DRAFT_1007433 [Suillus hirtellus]